MKSPTTIVEKKNEEDTQENMDELEDSLIIPKERKIIVKNSDDTSSFLKTDQDFPESKSRP